MRTAITKILPKTPGISKAPNLIRSLLEDYFDVQKYRIEIEGQLRSFEQGVSEQEATFVKSKILKGFKDIEKNIKLFLEESLKNEPVYTKWLKGIKGIGPILASGLIAWFGDIERFATISKIWAYAGLSAGYTKSQCANKHKIISSSLPVSCPIFADNEGNKCGAEMTRIETVEGKIAHKETGWMILQNSRIKQHMWKLSEAWVKTKGFGRKLYNDSRMEYDAKWKTPEDCGSIGCKNKKKCLDGHRYMAAKRKAVKIFLANYWMKARELKGLPVENPFIIGRTDSKGIQHTHVIKPEDWY